VTSVDVSGFRWQDDSTFVVIDKWTLAEELWSFGEDSLWLKAVNLSDEEMVRVWTFAGRVLHEARSNGEAAALGAVQAIEGRARPLARTRRRPRSKRPRFDVTREGRLADAHRIEVSQQFPHPWTAGATE
jgi:hypothetical protein